MIFKNYVEYILIFKFYTKWVYMSRGFRDIIDSEYTEINNLGMKPVISAMCDALNISEIIYQFVGPLDPRVKISIGTLIKVLIVNVLSGRTPLVHLENTFNEFECNILFGENIIPSDLNDDRLGKTLEILGSLDYHKLYSQIYMVALKLHSVDVQKVHIDTTNVSLEGAYETPAEGNFDVTYGDFKSGRKDLKQANIGLFVQQNGLPIGENGLAGNTSDVIWFREAIDELSKTFEGNLLTRPISVYDAAASNMEMFKKANELEMPSIIRVSNRFSISGEYTRKTWNEDN